MRFRFCLVELIVMHHLERDFLHNFKSFKLEAKADEVLKELRSGSVKRLIQIGEKLSESLSESVSPISTLVQGVKAGKGFLEYYSLKKYVEFFVRIHEVSLSDRERFVKELEENDALRERLIPVLLLVIEKVSEMDKMKVIANIINARTLYKIDNSTFFRMMHLVEQVSWPDLFQIYLKHCLYTDLLKDDKLKSKLPPYDIRRIRTLSYNTGIIDIKREFSLKPGRNNYDRETKPVLNEVEEITQFGIQFLTFAFIGFELKTKQLIKYEQKNSFKEN